VRDLPPAVRRYVDRAHAVEPAQQVRVKQVGEMWLKPGGRGLRFDAVEDFAVREVAFAWRARFKPAGFLRVVDRFADGDGLLEARLLGLIPVMRQSGPELAVGEALRYLAELVWAPHAMVANEHLEWRELDERHLEVATRIGSTRAAVRLELDGDGDVVGGSRTARVPRASRSRAVHGSAASPTTPSWTESASPRTARCGGSFRRGRSCTGAGASARSTCSPRSTLPSRR
jgi:hypothetical protein